MNVNNGLEITNTPLNISAAYNTWPYTAPKKDWVQKVPTFYINNQGHPVEWNHFNPPPITVIPGGYHKGTPSYTSGWYNQNMVLGYWKPPGPTYCGW